MADELSRLPSLSVNTASLRLVLPGAFRGLCARRGHRLPLSSHSPTLVSTGHWRDLAFVLREVLTLGSRTER